MSRTSETCCLCGRRLPGEKAMYFHGEWYCRRCEDMLFDVAWKEFCDRHYKKVGEEPRN